MGKKLLSEIMETAKRYPMMSQLSVVFKEAQFYSNAFGSILAHMLQNPMPHNYQLFAYKHKAFDKRKKLYKAVKKWRGANGKTSL